MTREIIRQIERDYWEEKADPIDMAEIFDLAQKALEQESRWIPVSEGLPNEYADVICCTNAGEVFIATYLGKMNDGVDCFDDDNGMMWEGDVIAWMPLPQQYKAKRSDEE